MKLYEIADAYRMALSRYTEQGEFVDVDELLDNIKDDFNAKACNVGLYIKELKVEQDNIRKRMEELNLRKLRLERCEENLKNYLIVNMRKVGQQRACNEYISIFGRKAHFVNVTDESLIPDRFFEERVERKLNKGLLKDKMQEGAKIEGANIAEKEFLVIS